MAVIAAAPRCWSGGLSPPGRCWPARAAALAGIRRGPSPGRIRQRERSGGRPASCSSSSSGWPRSYAVMALLGLLVTARGPHPSTSRSTTGWSRTAFTSGRSGWRSATKIGNTWSTRMARGVGGGVPGGHLAAVCAGCRPSRSSCSRCCSAPLTHADPPGRPPGGAARIPARHISLRRLRAHGRVLRADRLLPVARVQRPAGSPRSGLARRSPRWLSTRATAGSTSACTGPPMC